MHRLLRTFSLAVLIPLLAMTGCMHVSEAPYTTIYLVRHAEKATGPDPVLTPAGLERAKALAIRLGEADLAHIYSSDYARTRQTAAPVAKATALPVELYDPRQLEQFAEQLIDACGICLVVGHSNTTPDLVSALGGDPGEEINEATEFNRMYILTVSGQQVSTRIERFGN